MRQDAPEAPNRLWLTDIREHFTGEGKLYLCANKAVARRGGAAVVAWCLVYSARGSQFRSGLLQDAFTRHGLIGSMGQVGSAGNNATMESFFALLQKSVIDRGRWATRDELRAGIVIWIERIYHRRRRRDRLGRLTPIEYELTMDHTPAHAA